MLNSLKRFTDSCTSCVPSFEEQYAVVVVLVGSLIPRPTRRTGRKRSCSSSFEILHWKSAGRKCLQMASLSVLKILIGMMGDSANRTIHTL